MQRATIRESFSLMAPPTFRISRYEIKSPIGGGGMGTLYLARDPNTGRLVALKLLRANLDSGDLRARFAREAQALASLNHPNIVNIYDSGEFRGSPFIVMEYVRGETLAEKIKRQAPLSLSQKLKLMVELCAGLLHAHDAGVIHRDVKPANLMVDQYGRLKIVDFGIARVAEGLTRLGVHMTQVNMQIGTPGYMSPEQIEGGDIDHRSDLFAVGAVAYELLAYREAFSGANTRQIERKVLEAQPTPLASLVEGLDPAIAAIIDRALEKDPNNRYQDAATLEAAFERERLRLGPQETPAPAARATPVPGRKSRESRAEAAFQRSLVVYQEGAHDTARRFAIEALAEDPTHQRAFELLNELEPDRWHQPTPAAPQFTEVPPTLLSDGEEALESEEQPPGLGTVVSTRGQGMPFPGRATPSRGIPLSPTVVVPPAKNPKRSGQKGRSSFTPRYGWAAALVALAVVVAVGMTTFLFWPSVPGHTLTVMRPVGGTISGGGITCGTNVSDCTATIAGGEALEFQAQPDEGFTFAGFIGDCAPGGRTIMTAPRTCGATFVPGAVSSTSGRGTQLLTIAPPTGGTVVGTGITCGSLGSECSSQQAGGTIVTLKALADAGFTFRGFTGDCAPKGEALMEGPRTCGATFVANRAAATKESAEGAPPPLGRRGGGASTEPTRRAMDEPPVSRNAGDGAGAGGGAATPDGSARGETKAVGPPITAEAHAQGEIQRTLNRYRTAYERLDFQEIQRVFPTAPEAIRRQLRQYKKLEYTYTGAPEFVDVDPAAGTATVEVGVKMAFQAQVGGAQPPNEARVRFNLFRRDDNWLVNQVTFLPK